MKKSLLFPFRYATDKPIQSTEPTEEQLESIKAKFNVAGTVSGRVPCKSPNKSAKPRGKVYERK